MKTAFILLILIHAAIHLLGFFKAFELAQITQLTQSVSKAQGLLWLFTTLLFLVTALFLILKQDNWWMPAIGALILSQYLIFGSWQDARFGSIANLLILLVAISGFGQWQFYRRFEKDVQAGLAQTQTGQGELLTEIDLAHLPQPVQRYLRHAGVVGQPKVKNFVVKFSGQIRKNEQSDWMPFTSVQYNFLEATSRLFFMKATMKNLPVAGYHRYEKGDAFMDIRLLSLIPVQYQSGAQMGTAETVTFFNDMCMMAPATLIDKRIEWLETDGNQVKASFTTHGITITARLYFNEKDELINFISEERYALMEDGSMQQLPWSTPAGDYRLFGDHRLSGSAEAVYQYPEGPFVYGTFQTEYIHYNTAFLEQ